LRVTFNVSLPEGQRATLITVGKDETPIELEKYYKVTAPAYLADGGDGFTMIRDNRRNVEVIGRDEKVLEDYVKTHSPLKVELDGRIVINN
ncbi:apyrase-like, partial [Manduca sexta]